MAMAVIWTVMAGISVIYGAMSGQAEAVGAGTMDGAKAAVELCLSIGGMICLWSGVMELLERSGVSGGLSRLLRPVLCRLFPSSCTDQETANALSSNVSANILGLGNAATPMGIKAAECMERLGEPARGEISRLVVMNTASVQLLPTTIAAVRASAGAASAFDILPAVWISSAASVCAGLICERLLRGGGGR